MKIFMHWDMEGTSGLFHREQTWHWEPGVRKHVYEQGRQLLMADMKNAMAAAFEAGAKELIVCDTHSGGGNMRVEDMPLDARVTYLPRARAQVGTYQRWMAGLDACDALFIMGHHAKAGAKGAFLPHTWLSAWSDFRINGESVGEQGIETCYAAQWNVPFALFHGDEVACHETAQQYPWVVTAPVKKPVSNDLCTGPEIKSAHRFVAEKIAEAIEKLRRGESQAYKPKLPITVTIQYGRKEDADIAAQKPGIQRRDDVTIEYTVERHCDIVKPITATGYDC